jgi:arginyl-tRNA synthetase
MEYNNIYQCLQKAIIDSVSTDFDIENMGIDGITIEVPKDESHGDLSTNAAMIIAAKIKKNPREIAQIIADKLSKQEYFLSVEVAGPGFINFKFMPFFWQKTLQNIIDNKDFGNNSSGKQEKVNIEFVSANPTGPMHIGHARGAVYGDALARIMSLSGYDVIKEYYVNDAGSQIETLIKSAHLRYLEAFGEKITIPEGFYPGEYLKIEGERIKEEFGDKFKDLESNKAEFRNIIIQKMLNSIKSDLANLKIKHDIFFSEMSLNESDNNEESYIKKSISHLEKEGLIYKGKLPAPKGEEDTDWEDREQILFKSSEFGDDLDRSLSKSDGSYTYFAGDIAYAKSKIDRGFKRNLIVLGADHVGYVKRLKAVYKSLSKGLASADVILCQLVNFIEEGKPVKMSKRAGSFTTVADVIDEVGSDILRFTMLTRKNDAILDFDLDLVKSQTKENPVFYVQYAQVRALSVIRNSKENHKEIYDNFESKNYDLSMIDSKFELSLIRDLSLFPKLIESIASSGEVHKICYYLQSLAASFHSFWNLGKENSEYKFITEDIELSSARLALVHAVSKVIRRGLELIGVEPLDKM